MVATEEVLILIYGPSGVSANMPGGTNRCARRLDAEAHGIVQEIQEEKQHSVHFAPPPQTSLCTKTSAKVQHALLRNLEVYSKGQTTRERTTTESGEITSRWLLL